MANAALVRATTASPLLLLLAFGKVGCSGCDDGPARLDAEASDAAGGDAGLADAGDDASTEPHDAAGFDAARPEAGVDASNDAATPDDDAAVPEPPASLCPDAECPGASIQLAASGSYACALREGRVRCWGDNANGQLGNRARLYSASPISVVLDEAVADAFAVQVEAGSDHACARLQTGQIVCWGESRLGRLGDGSRQWNVRRPVAVVGVDDAVDLSVGPLMSCAVRASGAVECWGDLHAIGSTSEPRAGVETPRAEYRAGDAARKASSAAQRIS